MSKKRLDVIVSCLLIGLGILYLIKSINLPQGNSGELSSGLFPAILGIALIGLCIINISRGWKEKDKTVQFPGLKKNLITIGMITIYFILWQLIGYFYILTFLLLFILITFYRMPLGIRIPLLITNFLVSIGLTLFIYVLFSKLMYIAF